MIALAIQRSSDSRMRDHVQFYLNGKPLAVSGADAFFSLSDFLRRREGLTGTKVVCAEGDCGSCSVLIGRPIDGAMKYAAVTSCIQRVFQLDGAHVVTVEGLNEPDGEPNAIQRSMAKCHGAQCGFCTPGFISTLYQLANDGIERTRETATRALVGNLCRCTGYDAILRAATEAGPVAPLSERYDEDELVAALSAIAADDVLIETSTHAAYKPATLEQALTHRARHPRATIVAGATDVGVLANKRVRELVNVLVLGGVEELRGVKMMDDCVRIGAAASLTELEGVTLNAIPPLGEFLSWFGSPPIKNAGTLAGNLATGSPIGDSLPALMALGAEVELASSSDPSPQSAGERSGAGRGARSVRLDAFYTGYRQSVMRPDELIVAINIPRLRASETLKLYKVSKRKDLDISSVSAAIFLRLDSNTIVEARIAFGGVGPTVTRSAEAEKALSGGPITLERFGRAAQIIRDSVKPISDVRGSADYRRALAGNLILKCCHDLAAKDASVEVSR
jgi:xanthine dehydrogenase small subunit